KSGKTVSPILESSIEFAGDEQSSCHQELDWFYPHTYYTYQIKDDKSSHHCLACILPHYQRAGWAHLFAPPYCSIIRTAGATEKVHYKTDSGQRRPDY